jgi:zinc transport system substrate-binding protein
VCLVGCGRAEQADGRRAVVTGFYPLAWAAEQIGGTEFRVVNLTPAGAEPHDLELSPRDVAAVRDAFFVAYVGGGFQPALEDAVATRDGASLDVLGAGADPQVWLDPVLFAEIARGIGAALGQTASAVGLADRLKALDEEYRSGLDRCGGGRSSHSAFSARCATAAELPLAGRSEAEPSRGARTARQVRTPGDHGVREPLASARLVETVARQASAGSRARPDRG